MTDSFKHQINQIYFRTCQHKC